MDVQPVVTGKYTDDKPQEYRLARRPDGTYVLQGQYRWWPMQGGQGGFEWRDLPTFQVPKGR